MTVVEKLGNNVAEVNSAFQNIKSKIASHGVEVGAELRPSEYALKVDAVYEAGKQAQYDAFWDGLQNYGNRTDYRYAFFSNGFEYIRPKYKIVPSGQITNMCAECKNLKAIEKEYFDLSNISTTAKSEYVFFYCKDLTEFPDLGVPAQASYAGWWQTCWALKTIEIVRVNDNTESFSATFLNCYALENVSFDGFIPKSLAFNSSTKLSKASITNIIEHLSTTASGQTATFSKTAVDTAFETGAGAGDGSTSAEWQSLIAPKSNWTISLV